MAKWPIGRVGNAGGVAAVDPAPVVGCGLDPLVGGRGHGEIVYWSPRLRRVMRLTGTRVVVTGATSGLGNAMAEALVEAGARVAVTSRERSRAEAAAG